MKYAPSLAMLIVLACTGSALAQPEVDVDTLWITDVETFIAGPDTVEIFAMKVDSAGWFLFTDYEGYLQLIGNIEGTDTTLFPDPYIWFKTDNPTMGDSWDGMLPLDGIVLTSEEITNFRTIFVGAGTFDVWEVSVWDEDGTFMGYRWYSDGVGMIGWELAFCNETFQLELLSYSAPGGSQFWPMAVGNYWEIQTTWNYTSVDIDLETLTVDGSSSDWTGLTPVVTDPSGDDTTSYDGADIHNIYAAADDSMLYLAADFWDGAPDTLWGVQDLYAYRFQLQDEAGSWYSIGVSYAPNPQSEWILYSDGINIAGASVAVGNVIEIAVPLANLGYYAYELPEYAVILGDYERDYTCYNTVIGPWISCPISYPGDVSGDDNLTTGDIIYMVNAVLKAGPAPVPCLGAGDVNCDGNVTTGDIIYLVNTILKAGPPICDVCSQIPSVWTCP